MPTAPWDTCLLKNKQGAYQACLSNAVAILTHRPEWHNVIAFDAFAGVIVKRKKPPWIKDTSPEDDAIGDWTHEDSLRTAVWITREYGSPFHSSIIDEAVQVVSRRWVVHPVRDYLVDLKWDRKPRVDDFLIRAAGAPDSLYVRAVTKNFFLSAVARIMKPGEQVDTVLILEGTQGLGKSRMLRTLAGEDWFMDTLFNLGSKDGYQALRRKWIVEFSELDSLSRADLSRAKAFISSSKDTYRQSYGRNVTDFLRQCVFSGTVNPNGAGYLNDPTGARRFWPVTLTRRVDFKLVKHERDQLWAESYSRYKNVEAWHLRDPKLLKAAAEEAEARREHDPWEAHFRAWLDEHIRTKKGVTIEELLTKAVEVPKAQQGKPAQIQAGKALRAIGWTVVRRGTDGSRRYFPETAPDPGSLTSIPPIEKGRINRGRSNRAQGASP